MGKGAHGGAVTARALLVPDCGTGVGLGHLERMLALADALRPDLVASVVVPNTASALRDRVANRGHDALEVAGSVNGRAVAAAEQVGSELIVLDGYDFDIGTQEWLRDRASLVVVDDSGHPTACDLAVNPSPGGEDSPPAGAHAFLGGARFALLPAGLLQARTARARPRARRSVLVSTGAMDARGITALVATELLRLDTVAEVVAVVGPEMDRADLPNNGRLRVLIEPPSLAVPLSEAAVYVGAAGTTAVQAACVGTPAVITAVAENQRSQAAALAGARCAVVVAQDQLARECLLLLDDPARRAAMAERGRELVDGRGAARVADSIRRLVRAHAAR